MEQDKLQGREKKRIFKIGKHKYRVIVEEKMKFQIFNQLVGNVIIKNSLDL